MATNAELKRQCISAAASRNRQGVADCNRNFDGSEDPQAVAACLAEVRLQYDADLAACYALYPDAEPDEEIIWIGPKEDDKSKANK